MMHPPWHRGHATPARTETAALVWRTTARSVAITGIGGVVVDDNDFESCGDQVWLASAAGIAATNLCGWPRVAMFTEKNSRVEPD